MNTWKIINFTCEEIYESEIIEKMLYTMRPIELYTFVYNNTHGFI